MARHRVSGVSSTESPSLADDAGLAPPPQPSASDDTMNGKRAAVDRIAPEYAATAAFAIANALRVRAKAPVSSPDARREALRLPGLLRRSGARRRSARVLGVPHELSRGRRGRGPGCRRR